MHPLAIPFNGIYLTVVRNHAEGLSQIPCWERIGTKTGVYQCDGTGHGWIRQIFEIITQLDRGKHPFVNDEFTRETGLVK